MKDIFTGDIFEKIEPPHDVSFKIVGTALPTNQDMYFVAKWHEIFERYTSARLFVRKALEDNWDYWFNKMEDEKVQCAIEYKFKAETVLGGTQLKMQTLERQRRKRQATALNLLPSGPMPVIK